jgi:uncharacterized membrane protein YkvA (DUF1232 family)
MSVVFLRRRRIPWKRVSWPHFRTLVAALLDRRAPWRARLVAIFVIAYALWPFDLVPDAIPVLGWLDDLVIVPAGLWLAFGLIPDEVLEDARRRTETRRR